MALGDAVPDGGIGFLEAFAGDACSGVEEAEDDGEDAIGGIFPQQAHAQPDNEEQQAFACGFEQLGDF